MDVSDEECVARAAAYYKGRYVPRLLKSGTCNSKSRVHAEKTEFSVYISKDLEKHVVVCIYTVAIVHILVQTRALLFPFSPCCVLFFEQNFPTRGAI